MSAVLVSTARHCKQSGVGSVGHAWPSSHATWRTSRHEQLDRRFPGGRGPLHLVQDLKAKLFCHGPTCGAMNVYMGEKNPRIEAEPAWEPGEEVDWADATVVDQLVEQYIRELRSSPNWVLMDDLFPELNGQASPEEHNDLVDFLCLLGRFFGHTSEALRVLRFSPA
jgi:hypothetical protein